jgi:hypothetical protein
MARLKEFHCQHSFNLICCSSFVSSMSEGVLGGLADPRATLHAPPQWDPAQETFGGFSSVYSGKGLAGDLHRSDRCAKVRLVTHTGLIDATCCWPQFRANTLQLHMAIIAKLNAECRAIPMVHVGWCPSLINKMIHQQMGDLTT